MIKVSKMIIYLDLIILLNFIFDTLLITVVKITLKRNIKFYRILLGGFVGGISILFLFMKINSIQLFFLKIIISILMLLVTFGYKDKRYFIKNMVYLYLTSMILGGFLYFLNMQFSYRNEGLVFFYNGLSINFIFLIIFCPIILYIYLRSNKELKNNYNYYMNVEITFKNNRKITLTGFLDTGNKLTCPITNKAIILIDKESLKGKLILKKPILVPFRSLNNKSLLKCFPIKNLIINNKKTTNVLIGISKEKFNIDGVGCILNPKVMEELK